VWRSNFVTGTGPAQRRHRPAGDQQADGDGGSTGCSSRPSASRDCRCDDRGVLFVGVVARQPARPPQSPAEVQVAQLLMQVLVAQLPKTRRLWQALGSSHTHGSGLGRAGQTTSVLCHSLLRDGVASDGQMINGPAAATAIGPLTCCFSISPDLDLNRRAVVALAVYSRRVGGSGARFPGWRRS
jgi:hypothetical protein